MLIKLGAYALVMVGIAIVFGLLQRLWPSVRGRRRTLKSYVTDLTFLAFNRTAGRLVSGAIVGLAIASLAALTELHLGADEIKGVTTRDTLLGRQHPLLQFLEVQFIADFIGYWVHRVFHSSRRAWPVHAVHHSSSPVDWLSSARVHPVNDLVSNVLVVAPVLLMGFAPAAYAAYVPVLLVQQTMIHANVPWTFGPFRYVFTSPVYHRWHHSIEAGALNKNFAAAFPIMDVVFGTFYMPKGRMPAEFGAPAIDVPPGFWAQMVFPFRRARPMSAAALAAGAHSEI
jgi:sterol desaturase/sphingolipid hydroxylase (fatty acid hydroxylase superfamily)